MTEEKPVCPECGSTDHQKMGYTDHREQRYQQKQRYKCKDCGRSFIIPSSRQPLGYVCPRCESKNIIRFGYTLLTKGRRRQRLRCKDCNYSFYPPEEAEG